MYFISLLTSKQEKEQNILFIIELLHLFGKDVRSRVRLTEIPIKTNLAYPNIIQPIIPVTINGTKLTEHKLLQGSKDTYNIGFAIYMFPTYK